MRIQLVRSGGFSKERKVKDVDTSTLSSWLREEIEGLVRDSDFFSLPEQMPKTSWGSDLFDYRIVVTEESRSHTVETAERDAPENLLKLIRRIDV
jgi:hypothetical protein